MEWFYDNADANPVVERVYCLAWAEFTDEDWAALGRIYRDLPGWQPGSPDIARWFAPDDDAEQHLWASVEPSGLQVGGLLSADAWQAWDGQFRRAVVDAGLPRFDH
ncbi:hypothetical protein SAMN05421805_1011445 [Saccharopolyspora antimicrobica]|uniref:Uncharacterized protein n=1 Tax=Saccharopolyspora antimicrobica TaxID=455193 RepID=A0A1I4TIK4_9PSEU|nr:hypothetical protein [Saccharopolyspora antimicrobica]RKT85708.1 hypothetical protein ATL45_4058 [Saccharopolyspora antimicrobica]SFM76491.1 hypothetical protein SAMN05421805_1011445 [Saccharopolyspora antimicrobica]